MLGFVAKVTKSQNNKSKILFSHFPTSFSKFHHQSNSPPATTRATKNPRKEPNSTLWDDPALTSTVSPSAVVLAESVGLLLLVVKSVGVGVIVETYSVLSF